MKDAQAAFGYKSNTVVQKPEPIKLKVEIIDRLYANGDALLATKGQEDQVWVIDPDQDPPVAQLTNPATLDEGLQKKLADLKTKKVIDAKSGQEKGEFQHQNGRKLYACIGTAADAPCVGLAKPNATFIAVFS